MLEREIHCMRIQLDGLDNSAIGPCGSVDGTDGSEATDRQFALRRFLETAETVCSGSLPTSPPGSPLASASGSPKVVVQPPERNSSYSPLPPSENLDLESHSVLVQQSRPRVSVLGLKGRWQQLGSWRGPEYSEMDIGCGEVEPQGRSDGHSKERKRTRSEAPGSGHSSDKVGVSTDRVRPKLQRQVPYSRHIGDLSDLPDLSSAAPGAAKITKELFKIEDIEDIFRDADSNKLNCHYFPNESPDKAPSGSEKKSGIVNHQRNLHLTRRRLKDDENIFSTNYGQTRRLIHARGRTLH